MSAHRGVEDPVETVERGGTVTRHPAYAQIIVNRVSGTRALYGSDFEPPGYVSLSIHRSELHRSLSRDRPHADPLPIVRVAMTEAQWASMISSFGSGEGTQCTLERIGAEAVPTFPLRDSGQFYRREAEADIAAVVAHLDALEAELVAETGGVPKGKRAALVERVRQARKAISDHLPFVADSFSEYVERRVEQGKLEIAAWDQGRAMRAGIAAGEAPLLLGEGEPAGAEGASETVEEGGPS